jgi:hypothetical protein
MCIEVFSTKNKLSEEYTLARSALVTALLICSNALGFTNSIGGHHYE